MRLGPEQTQQILRRAAELDREHALPSPGQTAGAEAPRLDVEDLRKIAVEAGLSEEAVRRALVELHSGALEGRPPAPCTARHVFEEPVHVVEQRLDAALRANSLAPVVRAQHATQWLPAPGIGAGISRVLNLGGKGAFLGTSVESSVFAVPGQRTTAELRGHVTGMHTPIATVAGLLLAIPAGIALLVLLAIGLSEGAPFAHGVGMAVVAALWAILTLLISRGVAHGRTRKLQRALERMLLQLGH